MSTKKRRPTEVELRRRVAYFQHEADQCARQATEARRALAQTIAELHDQYHVTYRELGALLGTSHVAALKLARQAA